MTGFEGHRCWTPAGAADLPTEAVVASQAFFFATHAPLKIFRSDAGGRRAESAEPVTEEAVVADFLNRDAPGGVLLMPVIGESGTGKSHLVRWVKERTEFDQAARGNLPSQDRDKPQVAGEGAVFSGRHQ